MVKKCPQCKSTLKRVVFDVGYGVDVDSLHCGKCGFNITEDKKLKKALTSLKEQMTKEGSVQDFFSKSASLVAGLKSVGVSNFNQVNISDGEKFSRFVSSLKEKVFISYGDPSSGTSTLSAVYDQKEKMVELLDDPVDLMNENSAGFKLCAFYALQNGYNKKIEIYSELSNFGFSNPANEVEKRKWFDKLNPRFLE